MLTTNPITANDLKELIMKDYDNFTKGIIMLREKYFKDSSIKDKLKEFYPKLDHATQVSIFSLCVQKHHLDLSTVKDWERLVNYLFPGDLQDKSLFPTWILE